MVNPWSSDLVRIGHDLYAMAMHDFVNIGCSLKWHNLSTIAFAQACSTSFLVSLNRSSFQEKGSVTLDMFPLGTYTLAHVMVCLSVWNSL